MVETVYSTESLSVELLQVVGADHTVNVKVGIAHSAAQVESCPPRAEQSQLLKFLGAIFDTNVELLAV